MRIGKHYLYFFANRDGYGWISDSKFISACVEVLHTCLILSLITGLVYGFYVLGIFLEKVNRV